MEALESMGFTSATQSRIRDNLQRFQGRQEGEGRLRAAAVAVTVCDYGGECAVTVTQRAQGQIKSLVNDLLYTSRPITI